MKKANMKTLSATAVIVATVVAAGAATTDVYADSVKDAASSPSNVSQKAAQKKAAQKKASSIDTDSANKAVSSAQSTVNSDKKAVKSASNTKTAASTAKYKAQSNLDKLKNSLTGGSTINLSDKATAIANTPAVLDKGPASGTKFKGIASDKNVSVDTNKMTNAQATELSSYAAYLINDMRNQIGKSTTPEQNQFSTRLQVTDGAIAFAKQVAANYNSDKWSGYHNGWHDVPAIGKAAANFGLNDTDNFYEDMETWSDAFNTTMSMYDAKKMLYDAIYDMVFDDKSSDYHHALSLLGLDVYNDEVRPAEYFGVSFDKYGNIHLEIIIPEDVYIKDQAKFNATFDTADKTLTGAGATPDQIAAAQTALNNATATYNTASDNYTTAVNKLNADKVTLNNAKENAANVAAQKKAAQKKAAQKKAAQKKAAQKKAAQKKAASKTIKISISSL
ncbi:SEC10/PgrA surface exclusion-like protein [Weissella beninensis]|uniref:SEC10/PgrA surface exclusion domain-containing protein n=1 Tax=Periweissella beninensis TaxID=504936 RepID=A0ABT0VJF2_9LACO|nr:SEC10/PgrA surface exclusion domain-containing protein [Periweissella beninensis]MBM7544956.1 SEC10/PgrA surface exclusion-like protein [Periweissella beninensis]MCM2437967.1 SEC10/PgrA surface exclusion domain-containing protein [Periweissella beninensis]